MTEAVRSTFNMNLSDGFMNVMPALNGTVLKAVVLFTVAFIVYKIVDRIIATYSIRNSYGDIPSLPRHWLWGNLIDAGKYLSPNMNRHQDYGFEEIWDRLERPPFFLLDLSPIEKSGFLIPSDPAIAEQIVQSTKAYPYSAPKSDAMLDLSSVIGKHSIIIAEGDEWKKLRKRFNPGFQPSHLHSLSPLIIEKTRIFVSRLENVAKSNESIEFKGFAQDLTTDIITQLIVEEDYRCQTTPEGEGVKSYLGLMTASRISTDLIFLGGPGPNPLRVIDPVRRFKEVFYDKLATYRIRETLTKKLNAENSESKIRSSAGRAIVQLALAGQDTTATTIQWMCYEMSKANFSPHHATILTKLQAEHTAVFGPNPYSALETLSSLDTNSETILNTQLPYTTAFIKETLRLHPPGATARQIPRAGTKLHNGTLAPEYHISHNNQDFRVDGLRVYSPQWIIHRNPILWGPTARIFNPDRFLDEDYMRTVPTGSWRPFERGPRNCIGQELAMMEMKIVACAVARAFVFEKDGLDGRNGEKEVWNLYRVTTVPCDGMKMKVKMRDG